MHVNEIIVGRMILLVRALFGSFTRASRVFLNGRFFERTSKNLEAESLKSLCDGNSISFLHFLTSHGIRLVHADHARKRPNDESSPPPSRTAKEKKRNDLPRERGLRREFRISHSSYVNRDLSRNTGDYGLSSARFSCYTSRETGVSSLLLGWDGFRFSADGAGSLA